MHLTKKLTLFLTAGILILGVSSMANERQTASPVWGIDDRVGELSTGGYHIFGLDFDTETPGLELADEKFYSCSLESAGTGMIKVTSVIRIRFRSTINGSLAFNTNFMVMRSQAFPNPFDVLNQDASGNLLYAYVDQRIFELEDLTNRLQQAVTAAADPTDTLCHDVEFPSFRYFGVNFSTVPIPVKSQTEVLGPPARTMIFADSFTGGYALKEFPTNDSYDFFNPIEAIGTFKYWAIEVNPGAGAAKGNVLHAKTFNEQGDFNEATPDFRLDLEFTLIGDIRGTGIDVIRIVEVKPSVIPDYVTRRTKHFDVRTGALVGVVVYDTIID